MTDARVNMIRAEMKRLDSEASRLLRMRDELAGQLHKILSPTSEYQGESHEPSILGDTERFDREDISNNKTNSTANEFCTLVKTKVSAFIEEPALEFIPRQVQIIALQTFMKNIDAICVSPTGSGKTLAKSIPPQITECGISVLIEGLKDLALEQTEILNRNFGPGVAVTTCTHFDNEYVAHVPMSDEKEPILANPIITDLNLAIVEGSLAATIREANSKIRYLILTPEAICPPDDAPAAQRDKATSLVQVLAEMVRLGRVQQIVLDELHLVFLHRKLRISYQKLLKTIKVIRCGGCGPMHGRDSFKRPRLLGLTGTLTHSQIKYVRDVIGFDTNTVVHTESTDRGNLSYSVLDLGDFDGSYSEVIEESVNRLLSALLCSRKTMIFVATKKDCEYLAGHLTSKFGILSWAYHKDVETEDRLKRWTAWGNQQGPAVIVSTTLGGIGRNQLEVDLVIEMTVRTCINSVVQEFGRAGRLGQKSRCISVAHPILLQPLAYFVDFNDPLDHQLFLEVIRFVYTPRECRRRKLQSLLGDEVYCALRCPSMDDETAKGSCDTCDPINLSMGEFVYSLVDVSKPAISLLEEISLHKKPVSYTKVLRDGLWREDLTPRVANSCFMHVLIHYLRLSKATSITTTGDYMTLTLTVDALRSAPVTSHRESVWVHIADDASSDNSAKKRKRK